MKYIKSLDGLRAIAVLLVLYFHWQGGIFGPLFIETGTLGVYVFFVLSGFLISSILIDQKNKNKKNILTNFYLRRFLRIFPIYYLFISILYIINYDGVREFFLYFVFYFQNILFYNEPISGYITHLWSLAVEEQFYLIWPLLLILLTLKNLKNISYFIILLTPISIFLFKQLTGNYGFGLTFFSFEGFAWGYLLANNYHKKDYSFKINHLYLSFALFIAYVLVSSFTSLEIIFIERSIFAYFSFAIISFIIFNEPKKITQFLSLKPLVFLGQISYGIYLYHRVVPEIYSYFHLLSVSYNIRIPVVNTILLPYLDSKLMFIFYFPITIIISLASYYIIEKPLLKLKNKINY